MTKQMGRKTEVTTRFKKARIVCKYEVYETEAGGTFVARLIEYNGAPRTDTTWGEPADTALEACKLAYREWAAPLREAVRREQEYRRSGGY